MGSLICVVGIVPYPAVAVAVRVDKGPVDGLLFKVPERDTLRAGHLIRIGIAAFPAGMLCEAPFRLLFIIAVPGLRDVAAAAGVNMRAVAVGNRIRPFVTERRDLTRDFLAADRADRGLLTRIGTCRGGYGRPIARNVQLRIERIRTGIGGSPDTGAEIIGLPFRQRNDKSEIVFVAAVVVRRRLRSFGVIEIHYRIKASGGVERVLTRELRNDLEIRVLSSGRDVYRRHFSRNELRGVFHVLCRDRARRRNSDAQRHTECKQNSRQTSPHHQILLVFL